MNRTATRKTSREEGFLLLALIIVILILGVLAYAFVNIISTHQVASPAGLGSMKALYIKEGALEIGQMFVADYWAWAEANQIGEPLGENVNIFTDEPLGDGYFSLWVTETEIGRADLLVDATASD